MDTAINILKEIWGYDSFRSSQEEIISAVNDNKDVVALLPTGGGKSICFQVPALSKKGICIVISPLIALMKDQVENLKQKGIKAVALTGGIKYEDTDAILDNCIYGNYKFLYLSPERLKQEFVRNRIQQMPVNLIAIDEAHCISQWGNDFRPAYRDGAILRDLFPEVAMIALTASATSKVVDDIRVNLKMHEPVIVKDSYARPNIIYTVIEEVDKYYKIKLLLKKQDGTAIIYARSRRATIETANFLNTNGITATFYHGGISNIDKDERLKAWLNNEVRVMVATNAFGMGIDKPDVRLVIHINLPENIENYYQEAGRAGRDGKTAYAFLLKNKSDEIQVKNQFLNVIPDIGFIKLLYNKLFNFFQIPYGEGENTLHYFNFSEFCTVYKLNTLITYNGLKLLDRYSIISLSENFNKQTTVQFIVSNHQLLSYLDTNYTLEIITKAILRTYGGIFDLETKINLHFIAKKTGTTEKGVEKVLEVLAKDEIIKYKTRDRDTQITFLLPREDDKTINTISKEITFNKEYKERQIAAILAYTNNNDLCKSVQLLNYFGEKNNEPCRKCSVCRRNIKKLSKNEVHEIAKHILDLLTLAPKTSRELIEELSYNEQTIIQTIRLLLDNNNIKINHLNQYTIKA